MAEPTVVQECKSAPALERLGMLSELWALAEVSLECFEGEMEA